MNRIVDPSYQMTAFEINYSLSMTFSMITPLLASVPEPVPTIAITIIAILASVLTAIMNLNPRGPNNNITAEPCKENLIMKNS